MKKKLALLMTVIMIVLCFTGCKAKYADSEYLGTWKATTAEAAGVVLSVDSLFDSLVLTLDESGEAALDVNGEVSKGEWEETEKGFTVDGELEFTVDGSAATVEYEGMTITFEH